MKKVAVTGGAGFIGSNLVRRLLEESYEVLVIDDLSTGLKTNLDGLDCEFVEVSLLDQRELRFHLKDQDAIFHLGARGSVPRSIKNPQATFEVNVVGTLNVLDLAREFGSYLVFSSSSSVFGRNLELPKHERSWTAPITPYAASKLSGEALVQSYSESFDMKTMTFRLFNVFGPRQRPNHPYAAVIPKWIWKAMNGEAIEVFGDGEQSRDFTYIDTVVEVFIDAMRFGTTYPLPVNFAFGNPIKLNALIDEIRVFFPKIEVNFLPERKGDVKNSSSNPELLHSLFPDVERYNFKKGLRLTYDWLTAHHREISSQKDNDR